MPLPHETAGAASGHDSDGGGEAGMALLDFLAAFNGSTRHIGDPDDDETTSADDTTFDDTTFDDTTFDDETDLGLSDSHSHDATPTGEVYLQVTAQGPAWRPVEHCGEPNLGGGPTPYALAEAANLGLPPDSYGRGASKARWAAVLVATVAVASGGLFALRAARPKPQPALAALSPAQILRTTLSAAIRSGSTHLFESQGRGSLSAHLIGDVSGAGGTMQASIGASSLRMTSAGGRLYMWGDALSLRSFGFTASSASRYAASWITVPLSSRATQAALDELHLTTLVDDLINLSGPLSVVEAPAPGEIAVVGAIPANALNSGSGAGDQATLSISTSYPYLPLSLSYGDPKTGSVVDTFTSWGEKVAVATPANARTLPAAATPAAVPA